MRSACCDREQTHVQNEGVHVNRILAILITALLFASVPATASALKCKSADDAENYLRFNLPDKAGECYDRLINQDPTNARLHYLKGKFCLSQGDAPCAKARFSARSVKARYAKRIAALYRKRADANLKADNRQRAEEFYREAIQYNPTLAKEISADLLQRGEKDSDQKKSSDFLSLAGSLNPRLQQEIADHYYALSRIAPNSDERVDLLEKAAQYNRVQYSRGYEEARRSAGMVHLEQAKLLSRKTGSERTAEEQRAYAIKYLGEAAVEAEFPSEILYQPGEYSFQLQASEQTPSWISFPDGEHVAYTISATNSDCKIVYSDGESAAIGAELSVDRFYNAKKDKFKIVASTDQTEITMKVKFRSGKNGSSWWGRTVAPLWEESLGRFCFLSNICGNN